MLVPVALCLLGIFQLVHGISPNYLAYFNFLFVKCFFNL